MDKIAALKMSKGEYQSPCFISKKGKDEIRWWISTIPTAVKSLLPPPRMDYTIFTDATHQGWGAHNQKVDTNGIWEFFTENTHINILELLAIKEALKFFLPKSECQHIKIFSDNTTAISMINKQGGTKSREANDIAYDCWMIAHSYNCHLTAGHIPGIHNSLSDYKSKQYQESAEWMICHKTFQKIMDTFGSADIDLFASNENHQLACYASWLPDPSASIIDAFSIHWDSYFAYVFPPFRLLSQVAKKLREESDLAIVVTPIWPTQQAFVSLLELAIEIPLKFSSSHLKLPKSGRSHPLGRKLNLAAILVSKNQALQRQFRSQFEKFSEQHGDHLLIPNTSVFRGNTNLFVIQDRLIPMKQI